MARIRTVKPQFFKDGDLFDAEEQTKLPLRMAFVGLWTVADREGRFKWKPRDIKPDVLPFDNVNMADVLDALVACGKIQKYTAAGQEYGYIPGFLAHQRVNKREAESTIPEPPKQHSAREKRVRARAEQVRAPDESVGKGKERKGKEGDNDFDIFWEACPKKVAKVAAEKAYLKARESTEPAILLAGIRRYAISQDGKDPAYTKHPATWLNGGCWTDEDSTGPPGVPRVVVSAEIEAEERENRRKMGIN